MSRPALFLNSRHGVLGAAAAGTGEPATPMEPAVPAFAQASIGAGTSAEFPNCKPLPALIGADRVGSVWLGCGGPRFPGAAIRILGYPSCTRHRFNSGLVNHFSRHPIAH
jgi:hypothetical protein